VSGEIVAASRGRSADLKQPWLRRGRGRIDPGRHMKRPLPIMIKPRTSHVLIGSGYGGTYRLYRMVNRTRSECGREPKKKNRLGREGSYCLSSGSSRGIECGVGFPCARKGALRSVPGGMLPSSGNRFPIHQKLKEVRVCRTRQEGTPRRSITSHCQEVGAPCVEIRRRSVRKGGGKGENAAALGGGKKTPWPESLLEPVIKKKRDGRERILFIEEMHSTKTIPAEWR